MLNRKNAQSMAGEVLGYAIQLQSNNTLSIHLNEKGSVPLYQQLVAQIDRQIETGNLRAGEKLPTERELLQITGLARGTVKKAYAILCDRQKITITQGRGTFVQGSCGMEREREALYKINRMIADLKALAFYGREIEQLVHKAITMGKETGG